MTRECLIRQREPNVFNILWMALAGLILMLILRTQQFHVMAHTTMVDLIEEQQLD